MAAQYPMGTEKPVTLTADAYLELEAKYQGKNYILNGRSDYSLWYDDREKSTNFVICEAKCLSEMSVGVRKCLAYMGKYYFSISVLFFFWHFFLTLRPTRLSSNYIL